MATEKEIKQRQENVKAIAARRRAKTTCIRGHNNWYKRKDGTRICRTCRRDRMWYARRGLTYN